MSEEKQKLHHHLKKITPMIASNWLKRTEERGFKNRKLSQSWAARLAKPMKAGEWLVNGEPIIFDKEGCVIDGQHRLMACIQSGVPFTSCVIEGVDRSTFHTIDCGRTRSAAQVLNIEGIKYYTAIASIIRGVNALRKKSYSSPKLEDLSNSEVLDDYRAHCDEYDRIAESILPSVQTTKMMSPKLAGSVFFYLVNDIGCKWETVETFIKGCLSEESHPNEYINAFRRWLFRNVKTKMTDRIKLGNLVRAWNAMVTHGKVPKFNDKIDQIDDFRKE